MPNEFGDHNRPEAVLRMVEALLSVGADPGRVDQHGLTASAYANQWLDPEWKDGFGQSTVEKLNADEIETVRKIIGLFDRHR